MKCQICGKAAEVLCVCKDCLSMANRPEQAKKIRNIANILCLTACTDLNIKNAMESLLDVAGELEVFGHGQKQETKKREAEKKVRPAGQSYIQTGGMSSSTAENN